MGAIGGITGLAGGVQGTGYHFNQSTINNDQIQQALQGNQAYIGGQQNLLRALQMQGGLNNQTDVYNQMKGVAAGTGPNPAQAMLNQQTGQNIAAQGALMAGQRGVGANIGLMARQAAQQGAATQQQAVGQGATLQAQQSLNALGQMGNMANTQAGQQIAQTNALQQAQANQLANLLTSNTGMQSNLNNIYGQLASTNIQGQQGMIGNMMNSAGQFMSSMGGGGGGAAMMGARGGKVQRFEEGGDVQTQTPASTPTFGADPAAAVLAAGYKGQSKVSTPQSTSIGSPTQVDKGPGSSDLPSQTGSPNTPNEQQSYSNFLNMKGESDFPQLAARGGEVKIMVSPQEKILSPREAKAAKQGANAMAMGRTVPGTPKVNHNSYDNDVVLDSAPPRSVVLPLSVTKAKDPSAAAAKFMKALASKKGKK